MNTLKTSMFILAMSFNSIAVAGEAHICTSKVLPIEKQEQISDETIFKCAGIKNGKNTFTINELGQNNWQIISVEEGQVIYNGTKNEIYHQVVIQKP
jgi:hypothetical protein